jgi:DNA-binding transcriptional regulator LsrR (DeoR family)
VGGLTQDRIAAEPGVSRQRALRLVAKALAEGLVHVRVAQAADVTFVGVGRTDDGAPLYKDGFLTRDQLRATQAQGAAGEAFGGAYDARETYVETPLKGCIGGVQIEPGRAAPVIGVAAGANRVAPIRAAPAGRILNGLVTDEPTAQALLA